MLSNKELQLRKHKRIATGLFFLMAVVYSLMVYFQHQNPQSWMGYVEAFAEAGMVGALADWFAVTALFRHPLGIPIPHTNLIERKKNDLGENLGKFVKDNFLTPRNIRPYIEKLDVVKFVSIWLNKPSSKEVLEVEIINLLKKIIQDLDDDEVENFMANKSSEILKSIDYQKITSSGIHYMIEKDEHIKLLETLLPQIKEYIDESQQMIRDRISENRPFISFLAGKRISRELTDGLSAFIEEIEINKEHFVRKKLTQNLEEFAEELLISEKWNEKFEQLKNELISAENLRNYTDDAWDSIKKMLWLNIEEPNSSLKKHLHKNIEKLSENLTNDEGLGLRINKWIRHFLYRMILKNSTEVEQLISSTVSGWEGKELSEKLELEVGKDLQFIRINGTLVGGLVGLIIYFVTQLFTT
ncbi:DUF445 domain-containing protein [Moheibacter sediminis]|uniref:Uncharacterized membrane-anchored protein YjiN, DUF445 family n=1 Tax=Moheibacter sediminis TaxID=1434700 RepID=A0A1W1Y8Q8_9FLAO|nr:DUF445 domain-containing protein [Moheibacter sediminis]SMC32526.1 Uncharacterized membrane-anchored protein YjiN, DUF445 family [Moheibacter sediminis]